MEFKKVMHTAGLFGCGAASIAYGIAFGMKNGVKKSPIGFLKTGAILFPLAILIGAATEQIFDKMGWERSEDRALVSCVFALISSVVLANAAAARFRFTSSSNAGLLVLMITINLVIGISFIVLGIENIVNRAENQAPDPLSFLLQVPLYIL